MILDASIRLCEFRLVSRLVRILEDYELESLVGMVVLPGRANELLSLLEESGGLGYKDYRIRLFKFEHAQGSIQRAVIQLWRKSRLLGWIDNRKLMKTLTQHLNKFSARHEASVGYEPDSYGCHTDKRGPTNDFIMVSFRRKGYWS